VDVVSYIRCIVGNESGSRETEKKSSSGPWYPTSLVCAEECARRGHGGVNANAVRTAADGCAVSNAKTCCEGRPTEHRARERSCCRPSCDNPEASGEESRCQSWNRKRGWVGKLAKVQVASPRRNAPLVGTSIQAIDWRSEEVEEAWAVSTSFRFLRHPIPNAHRQKMEEHSPREYEHPSHLLGGADSSRELGPSVDIRVCRVTEVQDGRGR
jgi:hypothetical protein